MCVVIKYLCDIKNYKSLKLFIIRTLNNIIREILSKKSF